MDRTINFFVNGISQETKTDENASLLYILRNHLNLKGVRFGCGEGYCGACTVLVDGKAVQSCSAPVWSIEAKSVVTIEGAKSDVKCAAKVSEIIQLVADEQAAQCGFCIPGIVMSIYSFTSQNPKANVDMVLNYLSERNLCRCGSHHRIAQVIKKYIAKLHDEAHCHSYEFAE